MVPNVSLKACQRGQSTRGLGGRVFPTKSSASVHGGKTARGSLANAAMKAEQLAAAETYCVCRIWSRMRLERETDARPQRVSQVIFKER